MKKYNENSDLGYFLEVDIDYPKKLFNLHKDLTFLPERKKVNKCEKLICSIGDKEKYVAHIEFYSYSGWGEQKGPPTSFSPVTSTNVEFGPQNFLTFSFNPFPH